MNRISIVVFLLLNGLNSFAQTIAKDTNYVLGEVIITSMRLSNFASGTKTDSLPSAHPVNQNLADLLTEESPLFIKSYGLGSLATSSFRGGSASHTAILWNGFNINSPMNGQMDLSLIPSNLSDAVSIQYGGTSALWGSGAVGGTIHLNNSAIFNKGTTAQINLSGGSFHTYKQQVSVELSKKRFITSIKLFNSDAKNDFSYRNIFSPENTKITQSNAELKSYGLLSENYFLINQNQKINLFFWYQHTGRNIPPTMLQLINKANQVDNSYRITSEWKYDKKKTTSYIRAAYFNEELIYSDATYKYADTSHAQSIIAEAETKINISTQHFMNIGISNTFTTAISSGYPDKPQQNRTALFVSYKYITKNEKLKATVSARQETVKNKFIPFTYSAGADYQLMKCLLLKSSVSKVYRIPTFNDLYWSPGGNPSLLPESGYSGEIGFNLRLKTKNNKLEFTTEPTIFSRKMENWIIWLPGISYWSPQNMMNVWSRGMESRSTIKVSVSQFKITLSVLTNYVVSTNLEAKSEMDASVDKQLIYVPMYSGHAKFSIEYKGFIFSYRHNYTGYRYTSTDNTQYLVPFDLGSFYFAYKKRFKNCTATVSVQTNNTWNEAYQTLLNRAMPLQNFNTGIAFEFNKPDKNN